jgi:two-component system sensor histidine kinase/response regulator
MTTAAVLINVDDHEAARYARNRILSGAGFTVHDAATGAEALALADTHQPDLILLDIHLPDIHGIEVCRRLKRREHDASFMVLQISASAIAAVNAKEALDAGADGYLMEPVDPDVLVATVNALLRLRKTERALAHAKLELEAVNKELQRSNQDLKHFAFAASHDLQEPLRTIAIFVQLIEKELRDTLTDQQKGYFHEVLSGAGRLKTLIHTLLEYSQVSQEGRPQSMVDVTQALAAAVSNLRQSLEVAGCTVEVLSDLPLVWCDSPHLVSVFHNLLSNALKYRKADGDLLVKIHAKQSSPGEWTIGIQDNGMGIPARYHDQIFEPFKRLHGSEIPGTGLGLALCRRIIEAHGGRIWVESAAGEGATFFVTLRAATEC